MRGHRHSDRQSRGRRAYRDGHGAEWIAALYLMAKGYQIIAMRLKTPLAEIDLLARKGKTLAVIEVKRRSNRQLAISALGPDQQLRLLMAGNRLIRSRPSLGKLQPRLDLIALSPGRFPHHLRGLVTPYED